MSADPNPPGDTARRTPVHDRYADHGARLTEFAGWTMPVQFEGVMAEHRAVRTRAGLFDVSHMARFDVGGPGAEAFLDGLLTNDPRKLAPGALFYTALCQEDGGTIDDLVVYRLADRFLVVANAANHDAVWSWFTRHAGDGVVLTDRTHAIAQLALQGPRSQSVLGRVLAADLDAIGYYQWAEVSFKGRPMLISRNGYTGEDGFELYPVRDDAGDLWRALFEAGGDELSPVGLGARDTLRLEVGFALYGHELSRETTPVEGGIGWVVKTKERTFVGHERLRAQKKKDGLSRGLVGLEFEGRLIGRQGARVMRDGRDVGEVTSGTFGPSVEKGIALAILDTAASDAGTAVEVDVRGRAVRATITTLPFYTEGSHR